ARELARVVRTDGRLGFTAWRPQPELHDLYRRHGLVLPEGVEPFDWGKDGHAEELLQPAFELEIHEATWVLEAADGEGLWDHWRSGAPPFKARVDAMAPAARETFRRELIAYFEGSREGDVVRARRDYLLILGRR